MVLTAAGCCAQLKPATTVGQGRLDVLLAERKTAEERYRLSCWHPKPPIKVGKVASFVTDSFDKKKSLWGFKKLPDLAKKVAKLATQFMIYEFTIVTLNQTIRIKRAVFPQS